VLPPTFSSRKSLKNWVRHCAAWGKHSPAILAFCEFFNSNHAGRQPALVEQAVTPSYINGFRSNSLTVHTWSVNPAAIAGVRGR
jgi:hypothetical protein